MNDLAPMEEEVAVRLQHTLFERFIVTFEPCDFSMSFENKQMRADAVQEETVVADDHRATRERTKRVFQYTHRVDVQVVRRFVQQQEIAACP